MPGDTFYSSPPWRALRARILARDGYRCTVCGVAVSGRGEARVDHIKPRSTHPHLALEPTNLRTLCILHDQQGHREKGGAPDTHRGKRRERFVITGCDETGTPLDTSSPWFKGAGEGDLIAAQQPNPALRRA